jgi:hypothetical protein
VVGGFINCRGPEWAAFFAQAPGDFLFSARAGGTRGSRWRRKPSHILCGKGIRDIFNPLLSRGIPKDPGASHAWVESTSICFPNVILPAAPTCYFVQPRRTFAHRRRNCTGTLTPSPVTVPVPLFHAHHAHLHLCRLYPV